MEIYHIPGAFSTGQGLLERIPGNTHWGGTEMRGGTWEQMPEASCHVPAFLWENFLVKNRPLDKDSQRAFPSQSPLGKCLTQWVSGFIWELCALKAKNTLMRPHITGKYRRGELEEDKWLTIKWSLSHSRSNFCRPGFNLLVICFCKMISTLLIIAQLQ